MDSRTKTCPQRVYFHPYRPRNIPLEDQDEPYEPRIEDDSLLYLAFDKLENVSMITMRMDWVFGIWALLFSSYSYWASY
ncbi:hypothetical protein L218DRAFT_227929 [Marasmius fiardii PR-910]|nr:hypothetical protein L218DRAFT_227929 [Marasmius fiardii PR-910]